MRIKNNASNVKIEGHEGEWYVVDHAIRLGRKVFLLEHEEYGDEAANIIVDEYGNIMMEDVWNGICQMDEQ